MRTNLFGGAVIGLLCLTATSFAGWNATDKALGHEGKTFDSNRGYYSQQSYRSAPVMSAPVVVAAPQVAPTAVPQVAQTNSNTVRRSFSVEPNTAPIVNNNVYYSAPRSYNNNNHVNHQPNYLSADTKALGREGR